MEVEKTNTIAQQISIDEYEKQKNEYTQNALKELRDQMRSIENNFENPKKKIQKIVVDSDNSDNDNYNNESDGNINIVIQRDHSKSNKLRNRKNNTNKSNNEIDSQLFEKYDQSHKIIQGLKDVNKELEEEITSLDKRLHFMKLELNNVTVDISDLQRKHNCLIIENNKLKLDLDTEKKNVNYEKSLNVFLVTLIFIQFLMILFY